MLDLPNMHFTRENLKHRVAVLPIQDAPADGVISLGLFTLTKKGFRGDGWYAKLKLNKETLTTLQDRPVKG
jgi:hypothetical protein